jgi:holin-like protein
MLRGLAILLIFQSIGEIVSGFLHRSIPGPVIGMVLLFVFLVLRKSINESISLAADSLLAHLSIFFIPAAVGVMLYASVLARSSAAWMLAILLSTVAAIATTALVLKWLSKPDADNKP